MRPAILRSFGWQIINVFAKDWLEDNNRVINSIIKQLNPETQELSKRNDENISIEKKDNNNDLDFTFLKSEDGEKFWEIAQKVEQLHIRFGKTATKGQVLIKSFLNANEAEFAKQKLVEEQMNLKFAKDISLKDR